MAVLGKAPRRARALRRAALVAALGLARWGGAADAAITSASISLSTTDAGAAVTATVSFTTSVSIPVDGTILVAFPSSFQVAPTTVGAVSGIDASSTVSSAGTSATVTVQGSSVGAGSAVSFSLDGVTNPGAGTTASFGLVTRDAAGAGLDSASVAGAAIVKTSLSGAAVAASTSSAGAAAAYTVSFSTAVELRAGSLLELEFPVLPASQYVISGAALAGASGVDAAASAVQVLSQYVRLVVGGAAIAAGAAVAVTFGGVRNPAAQSGGAFVARTRHVSGAIYQESGTLTGAAIVSAALPAAAVAVSPASHFGGVATAYTVAFDNADVFLPSGSRLRVDFPARFDVGGAALAGLTGIAMAGTALSVPAAASAVELTLGALPVAAGAGRAFSFSGVVNPGTSCDEFLVEYCAAAWEDYALTLTDSAGNVFAQASAVPGTPIVKKPLRFARVRPARKGPSEATSASVALDTEAEIPAGGAIEVEFPAGFAVDAAAAVIAGSPAGFPAGSVGAAAAAGLVVSLAINAGGAAVPPSTGLSFAVSGVTTPPLRTVGAYVVRTRDAHGSVMEESAPLPGEGCVHLGDCSGHGRCSLLAARCVCDEGWGSPSDVAAYRSPDCSTRVCPAGAAWGSVPSAADAAHDPDECSGMGICDRATGRCACFEGFTGAACDRMVCPNSCSGRGRCATAREMAGMASALPLGPASSYAGQEETTTWDQDRIPGCVCDSGWAVGTGAGELQATEYFGADCSRRHCPTGDDPDTDADETDCEGVAAPGSAATGAAGNRCLAECSNRGTCDYRTGLCACFEGYAGFACQSRA